MNRSKFWRLAAPAFVLALAATNAMAQGFPGRGGHGGHGGSERPSSAARSTPSAEMPKKNALAVFFADLRALRMDLLLQENQLAAWTSMQEALRTAVELDEQRVARGAPDAIDPLAALQVRVDDMRERADALTNVDARVRTVLAELDERQRKTFLERFAAAFVPDARVANP